MPTPIQCGLIAACISIAVITIVSNVSLKVENALEGQPSAEEVSFSLRQVGWRTIAQKRAEPNGMTTIIFEDKGQGGKKIFLPALVICKEARIEEDRAFIMEHQWLGAKRQTMYFVDCPLQ